jgi:acylphosphatase
MAVRRRVVVHGRVQGVFFRDSAERLARSAGVSGWVRNRNDGAVEAAFEGEPEAVDRMVAWMREGPRRADVERIEVADEDPVGDSGFRVR